ncbi:hypothetical protein K523DRAFT_135820 [Schizophyllum commune Tattone D]|nr:hypothetical protein K523DRAFT_135820 [Schizophyllum commune Tattone D]
MKTSKTPGRGGRAARGLGHTSWTSFPGGIFRAEGVGHIDEIKTANYTLEHSMKSCQPRVQYAFPFTAQTQLTNL